MLAPRWLTRPIIVAFSSSLVRRLRTSKPAVCHGRRTSRPGALGHVANIHSRDQTTRRWSSVECGDRINLITVSADNTALFGPSQNPGAYAVFSDSGGAIIEADIALNPTNFLERWHAGTYDLESTFVHEIGHLLGLEHSAVIGATMQPRQA